MKNNAIQGFHMRRNKEGKMVVSPHKRYIWYLPKKFRELLDEPVKPGDVVLVETVGRKGSKKKVKAPVLVMEVFKYEGDCKHKRVLKVLEKYQPKEKEQI